MSYKTYYFADSSTVMHVGLGRVTGADLLAGATRVGRARATYPVERIVADFGEVEIFDVTPEDLQTLAETNVRAAKALPRLRVLIIASSDYIYGMCRMWTVYVQESGADINLIRDRSEVPNSFGGIPHPDDGEFVPDPTHSE